jgi:hypothetical protein
VESVAKVKVEGSDTGEEGQEICGVVMPISAMGL